MSDNPSGGSSPTSKSKSTAPVTPPTGRIPEITTARPLTAAIFASTILITCMIGLYVLLIGAWGYLTGRFVLGLPEVLARGSLILSVFACAIALTAVLVLAFLIKPLIPLKRSKTRPIEITADQQPELFEYINALADCIDAPRPERVMLDVDANASASFTGGLFGAIGGQFTLTLGLPLFGSLSVRQFAGIVAHELGHFSQGHMIRQNILISIVSGWMTDVAMNDDFFDNAIHRLANEAPFGLSIPFKLVRLITNAIRRLLFGVMIVGHATTRIVARQLEYDADQYMAHTAGSTHFVPTMNEVILLAHAGAITIDDAERFYRDRRLPTNLPAMIIAKARRFTPEHRAKLLKGHEQTERESFSTHPLTRKRAAACEALKSPGIVHDDRPAHLLIRNFDELCTSSSEAFYKNAIGEKYDPSHLADSSLLISELNETDKARASAMRFCQSEILLAVPSFPSLKALKLPAEPKQALREIHQIRTETLSTRTRAIPLLRKLAEAHERLMGARQGLTIVNSGFEIKNFAAMGLAAGDRAGLSREIDDQTAACDRAREEVRSINEPLAKRIELALGLLQHDKVAQALTPKRADRMRREAAKLIPAGKALASVKKSIDDLQVSCATLHLGLSLCSSGMVSQQLIARTVRASDDTRGVISDLLQILYKDAYPFAHGEGKVSIAKALCERPPDGGNAADIYFVAEEVLGRYREMRVRIMGRLCHLAEKVEKAMGLKPLPDPEEADALDELMDAIGYKPMEEKEPTAGQILMESVPIFGHGLAGLAVLAISGTVLYYAGGLIPGDPSDRRSARQVADNDTANQSDDRRASLTPTTAFRASQNTLPTRPTVRSTTPSFTPSAPRRDPAEDEPAIQSAGGAILALGSRRSSDQEEAAQYLIEHGPGSQRDLMLEKVHDLVLNETSRDLHELALELLEAHSPDQGLGFLAAEGARALFPTHTALVEYVSTQDPPEAARVLVSWLGTQIGQRAEQVLQRPHLQAHLEPLLLAKLASGERDARRAALRLLEGVATEASVPVLTTALADEDLSISRQAEDILEKVSPRSVDAAAKFLAASKNPGVSDHEMRSLLHALANLPGAGDPRLREVCTAIVQLMRTADSSTTSIAWRALAQWADEPALAVCQPLLLSERSPRDQVRTALQVVASQQTPEAAESIVLWLLLETDAARTALIRNGPASERAVLEHITNDNADIRLACCQVLGEVGGRGSLTALNGRGGDRDPRVSAAARQAFFAIRERLNQPEQPE